MIPVRTLPAAPSSLRPDAGSIPFGRYLGSIADLDTRQWDWNFSLGKLPRRFFERKAWTYFGVFSPRILCGFAIADVGYLANAFVYVFDRETRTLIEEKALRPLGFPYGFRPSPTADWSLTSGKRSWKIRPRDHVPSGWTASFRGARLEVDLELTAAAGMSTVAPATTRPFNYTYKACALPSSMRISLDGKPLFADSGLGVYDFTLGYPPRQTFWNWAGLAGHAGDGRTFGANLVANFNNGLENAIWLGNTVIPLGQAVFRYDRARTMDPWHVFTEDGQLDLRFFPEGKRAERIEMGLIASDFQQPCGRFEGVVQTDQGPVTVSGNGVVEEHWAVW